MRGDVPAGRRQFDAPCHSLRKVEYADFPGLAVWAAPRVVHRPVDQVLPGRGQLDRVRQLDPVRPETFPRANIAHVEAIEIVTDGSDELSVGEPNGMRASAQ